ncbi:MAG: glycosyltransferase, partial [Pseudomonadota bacterium]
MYTPLGTDGADRDTSARSVRLSPALSFLTRYGFDTETLQRIELRAAAFGAEPLDVLLRYGHMRERDYFRALAIDLGLDFEEPNPVGTAPLFDVPSPRAVELQSKILHGRTISDGARTAYLAPDANSIAELRALVERRPSQSRSAIAITTRACARSHMEARARPALLRNAIDGLRERLPLFSARTTIMPRQAVILLILLQVLIGIAFFAPGLVALAFHLTASMFYLACVTLRLLALADFSPARRRVSAPGEVQVDRGQDHLLPVYSVVVALYDEANQVFALLDALTRLDWPLERLEIVLVCEGDDEATLTAAYRARAAWPDGLIRIEAVPPSHPRTKPKALNYALPLCRGDYLVIYDAEDRPDPMQLREAYTNFRKDRDGTLACLQAPLVIHNSDEGFLPRLFTVEYSSLFDGLLPYLARKRLPLPLGGTSNHFRMDLLRDVGGWDAHNVTEDADLGLRIARNGLRISTLRHPTLEEAPVDFLPWLKQRTRWFKGWFQTWLVHMRHPIRQMRELGWRGTIAFHVLVTGMVVSALVHPVLL